MRAFSSLILLAAASCASYPYPIGPGTHIVFGRIASTPTVDIWLGHVTMDDVVIYEVALNNSRNTLVGFIPGPDSGCPYNSRPREQLFRIEYMLSSDWVVYPGAGIPRHLVTRNVVTRCDLVTVGDAGRH
jgi:hypothetical protein